LSNLSPLEQAAPQPLIRRSCTPQLRDANRSTQQHAEPARSVGERAGAAGGARVGSEALPATIAAAGVAQDLVLAGDARRQEASHHSRPSGGHAAEARWLIHTLPPRIMYDMIMSATFMLLSTLNPLQMCGNLSAPRQKKVCTFSFYILSFVWLKSNQVQAHQTTLEFIHNKANSPYPESEEAIAIRISSFLQRGGRPKDRWTWLVTPQTYTKMAASTVCLCICMEHNPLVVSFIGRHAARSCKQASKVEDAGQSRVKVPPPSTRLRGARPNSSCTRLHGYPWHQPLCLVVSNLLVLSRSIQVRWYL